MDNSLGFTVDQLIEALTEFRNTVPLGGDMAVLDSDYSDFGDLEVDGTVCRLMYKDLNRLPLRPYTFEEDLNGE